MLGIEILKFSATDEGLSFLFQPRLHKALCLPWGSSKVIVALSHHFRAWEMFFDKCQARWHGSSRTKWMDACLLNLLT